MKKKEVKKKHLLNSEITTETVRLVDQGLMTLNEALNIAESNEMDLVLMSESNGVGICKVMDYEKFIYSEKKKLKVKTLDVKEIKLGPNIGQNDLEYRVKQGLEFLSKGHKLKITLQLRGREMSFQDKAMSIVLNFIVSMESKGIAEQIPKLEGKKIITYIKPNKK